MIDLGDLFTIFYWLALLALVLWWVRGMRRAARPRTRTAREEVELASVQAALARLPGPASAPLRKGSGD